MNVSRLRLFGIGASLLVLSGLLIGLCGALSLKSYGLITVLAIAILVAALGLVVVGRGLIYPREPAEGSLFGLLMDVLISIFPFH